jgi:hypothetical protein
MNKKLSSSFSIIAAMLVGLSLYVVVVEKFSHTFHACISQQPTNDADQTGEKPNAGIHIVGSGSFVGCHAQFIVNHETFVAALSTGLLTVITFGLAYIARAQYKTTHAQLRAYVSAMPATLITFNANLRTRVQIAITNRGQTPATDIMCSALVDIFEYPLPPNFKFPNLIFNDISRAVLFPAEPLDLGALARHTFQIEEIEECIDGGNLRAYVFGIIKYIDVFDEPHETFFCSSIVGGPNLRIVSNGGNVPSPGIRFERSRQHNEIT